MTRDAQAKVAAGLRAPQPDMWFSLGLPRNLISGFVGYLRVSIGNS
jgi:hypothetical protein